MNHINQVTICLLPNLRHPPLRVEENKRQPSQWFYLCLLIPLATTGICLPESYLSSKDISTAVGEKTI